MTEAEDRSGWVKRPTAAIKGTGCTLEDYQALYARSIEDSDTFWAGQADRLDWIKDPTVIANWSYDPVSIKWFENGVLNICHNAVVVFFHPRMFDSFVSLCKLRQRLHGSC